MDIININNGQPEQNRTQSQARPWNEGGDGEEIIIVHTKQTN